MLVCINNIYIIVEGNTRRDPSIKQHISIDRMYTFINIDNVGLVVQHPVTPDNLVIHANNILKIPDYSDSMTLKLFGEGSI